MQYIYIIGLEHSGTTLTEDLLSRHPQAVGVGEAANFFDREHMRVYFERWGEFDDVRMCSCGQEWDRCEFWSGIVGDSTYEDLSFAEKYPLLINRAREYGGEEVIVIDSSKSIKRLEDVKSINLKLGLEFDQIGVVLNIKDVRSFAQSMVKKNGGELGIIGIIRAFNYWLGANREFFDFLRSNNINYAQNNYEALCQNPNARIVELYGQFGISSSEDEIASNKSRAHIAIGNKGYVMRNRAVVKYDDAWRSNWRIKLIYAVHVGARKLNGKVSQLG